MNKNNNRKKNNGVNKSDRGGGRNRKFNNNPWKNQNKNHRRFQKFVDTERMNNTPDYWPQHGWDDNINRGNDNYFTEPAASGGIHPWIRNEPVNNLIIPQHINFDEQYEKSQQERGKNTTVPIQQRERESIQMGKEPVKVVNREISVPPIVNTEVTKDTSEVHQSSVPTIKIKQEKDLLKNLKQEKKSSSSSSSSESSSSEDEPERNIKSAVPLKAPVKITEPAKLISKTSSSSSSSSADEEASPPPSTPKTNQKRKSPSLKNKNTSSGLAEVEKKAKVGSEDDVVCVGRLDNKIVLEDETDSSSTDEEPESESPTKALNMLQEKSEAKTIEKCMMCDKKGHTSFQCQMICKNCSVPYHGYRTCPQPANLNTMLQLFIEFCMQQLQHFQEVNQSATSNSNDVPKPKIDSSHSTSTVSKSNKLKRKHVRTTETNRKHKKTKKRKGSVSKKTKSKTNSDASSDDDNEKSCSTETSSTETDEHSLDSSAETLVSSKKKRKLKNVSVPTKASLDLSSFAANSAGLPMVLNPFSQLNVPATSIQNPITSTNALNTLLLTQMFQNAIGSLKK